MPMDLKTESKARIIRLKKNIFNYMLSTGDTFYIQRYK